MKRAMVLTLVLFVLGLGGLAAVTLHLSRTQEQVVFTNIVTRGDDSAAQGLRMTEHDLLEERVQWTTEHELGTESRTTKTAFSGKELTYFYYGGELNEYALCALVPDTEQVRTDLKELDEDMDGEVTLQPAKYADYYSMCLTYDGVTGRTMLTETDRGSGGFTKDFPPLRIPVEEDDRLYMDVYGSGSGLQYYCRFADVVNSFQPHDATVEAGTVVTVGFDAHVRPEADWAPEGFGLWLVGRAAEEEPQEYIKLVYPLDIDRQRVVKLVTSPDRSRILLFLAEDGHLTLQVLRSDDFTLLQTFSLGEIGVVETEESCLYGSGQQEAVTRKLCYDTVLVRRGEDFFAVAVDKQLTVLQSGNDGRLEKLFSCPMPDLYALAAKGGFAYAWEDEDVDPERILGTISPTRVDGGYGFETMSMALRDGKLAMAWRDNTVGELDIMVEIFSEDGLEYARGIACGLYHQERGSVVLSERRLPELVWAE